MTDTQSSRVPSIPQLLAALVAAVAVVTLSAVTVAGLVPSRLVASRDVDPDPDVTEMVDTPFARVPATAEPVADLLTLDGLAAVLPPDVSVDTELNGLAQFVTITEPAQSALSWWVGRDLPEVQFMTYTDKYGVQTPSERRTVSLQMMRTSSQVAQYVALERAGFDVALVEGVPQIGQFICLEANEDQTECVTWSPAEEPLERGDTIVSVAGTAVATGTELGEVLAGFAPGDTVDVVVERGDDGEVEVPDVELIGTETDEGTRTLLGVVLHDNRSVDLPFEIDIDTGEIGGSSAGLAFTLTLLDALTGGDLLGDQDVAVTGTINLDGTVGPIGGLVQKTSAVRQRGDVGYFLVPAGQSDDEIAAAKEVGGDAVEIIPVATLDEALEVLARLGGDPPELLVEPPIDVPTSEPIGLPIGSSAHDSAPGSAPAADSAPVAG